MKISSKVEVKKQKDIILVDFSNNGSQGTIFKIKEKEVEDKTNNVGVRLTKETARKLGEALIKLSKEK